MNPVSKPAGEAKSATEQSPTKPVTPKSVSPVAHTQPAAPKEQAPSRKGVSIPAISVETAGPSEINVGRRTTFTITVRNEGQTQAQGVRLEAKIPASAEFVASEPRAEIRQNTLQYDLGSLPAKEARPIKIEVIPRESGPMDLQAEVLLATTVRAPVQVRRPAVSVKFTGPAEVVYGDTVKFKVVISNSGDGPVENISIAQLLPRREDGEEIAQTEAVMEHVAGKIARLLPGQSTEIVLPALASQAGQMQANIMVKAADGLEATASTMVRVLCPAVELKIVGPDSRNVQRPAGYLVTVCNTGDVDAENVVVAASLPPGMEVVGVEKRAILDRKMNAMTWKLAKVEPGQTELLKFQAKPTAAGEQRIQVVLTSDRNLTGEAFHVTQVSGQADLTFSVEDNPGPIETGQELTYEVRVKNCGTRPAKKVALRACLPPGLTAVKSPGYSCAGSMVEFDSIEQLGTGAESTLQLTVICHEPGDRAIEFKLASDALEKELTTETSTLFFAPNRPAKDQ